MSNHFSEPCRRLVYAWEGEVDGLRAEIGRLRQRVADAEADALQLHSEKMALFDTLLGVECALARDGDIDGAMKLILANRANQQIEE